MVKLKYTYIWVLFLIRQKTSFNELITKTFILCQLDTYQQKKYIKVLKVELPDVE